MAPCKLKRRGTWWQWSTNDTRTLNTDTMSQIREEPKNNQRELLSSNSIPRFHHDNCFCNLYRYSASRFLFFCRWFSANIYFILHSLLLL